MPTRRAYSMTIPGVTLLELPRFLMHAFGLQESFTVSTITASTVLSTYDVTVVSLTPDGIEEALKVAKRTTDNDPWDVPAAVRDGWTG